MMEATRRPDGNYRYANIGNVLVAVIKEAVPATRKIRSTNMPLERSEVIRALYVLVKNSNVTTVGIKRNNGRYHNTEF